MTILLTFLLLKPTNLTHTRSRDIMTKAATVTKKKLPGVLSLNRCINVRDGLFFNKLENGEMSELKVMRSGMRGTQNVNGKNGDEVNNVQTTDTAKSDPNAAGVVVKTGLCFTSIAEGISSCAAAKGDDKQGLIDFKNSYTDFVNRAISDKNALIEIGCRYARNIANARWLWRNRSVAFSIKIIVAGGDKRFEFDGISTPIHHFDNFSEQEVAFGTMIAECLAGERRTAFEVEAHIDFGGSLNKSVEVYPSQNYLTSKPTGFSRSLYAVGARSNDSIQTTEEFDAMPFIGQAAIRDTKIANAFRTFDTWYADFDEVKSPIAIEPCGANLGTQRMHRKGADTSFAMFKRFNEIDPASSEGLFVLACIIRGGVYSEGGEK